VDQHISNADTAPGFNQAIACMVAAVGVCHLVAARCGPAAKPPICMFGSVHHDVPITSHWQITFLANLQLLCMSLGLYLDS
jgi:hypothetical protein